MRLLFLGINYDPEIISIAVYSSGLCEYMARNGVDTKVVTAKPYFPQWRVFEGWRGPFWKRRKTAAGALMSCLSSAPQWLQPQLAGWPHASAVQRLGCTSRISRSKPHSQPG